MAAKIQTLSKQEYEAAMARAMGRPIKLTDAQYQKLVAGKKLSEAEVAQASGFTVMSNYDQGGSAYDPKPTTPAPLPDFGNSAVPASMAEGSPWWADPDKQWQPYQGKVAAVGKAPSLDMARGPKDAARYSGFEDDAVAVGGADATKGTFKGSTPLAPAAPAVPKVVTEETYTSAFGPAPAATAPIAETKPGEWKATGNPMDAMRYAASMGTRASNRARWDDDKNKWVTEFEDLGLTPTGAPKGGAVGRAIRATGKG